MVDQTDFLDLYRKLRLDADCTLAEFKQAYRRHVALWHPDRRRGTRADAVAAARLQRLTVQYAAAMDFYKRHGRLPGAPVPPRFGPGAPDAAPMPYVEDAPAGVDEGPGGPRDRTCAPGFAPDATPVARMHGHAWTPRWKTAAVAIAVAASAWSLAPVVSSPEGAAPSVLLPAATATPLGSMAARDIPSGLLPGMTGDEVILLEGEPTMRGQDHWEYGPSWVQFEGGVVSEWHSSPLRPLHIASRRAHP